MRQQHLTHQILGVEQFPAGLVNRLADTRNVGVFRRAARKLPLHERAGQDVGGNLKVLHGGAA